VVSVKEKASPRGCQVKSTETSGSEPSKTCRKSLDDVKTGGVSLPWEQCGKSLCTAHMASGIEAA
jgi:hypothetical protein